MQQQVSINSYNLMHNTEGKLECNFKKRGKRLVILQGLPGFQTLGQCLLDDTRLASISCLTCTPGVLSSSESIHQYIVFWLDFDIALHFLASLIYRTYMIYAKMQCMHMRNSKTKHHAIANMNPYKVTTKLT